MWAFAVLVLVRFEVGLDRIRIRFNKEGALGLFHLIRHPAFLAVTLFFFLIVFSFWQTEDYQYWLARIRIKIPFLIFPLMFVALPAFKEQELDGLFYFLLFALLVTSLGIGIYYLWNAVEINEALKRGQPMPTPHNHIRFSLLLAYGIIGGGYLFQKGYYLKWPQERWAILGTTIFLFLFIHFLSVRSGLLALYATLGVLMIRYVLISRRLLVGLGFLAIAILMPYLAFRFIPSFQSKIAYMKYDYFMYSQGKGDLYADSGRIVSIKVGMDIARRYPWLGVGAGNLKQEVERVFEEQYPQFEQAHMPHNQFLFVKAGNGTIGLLIFLFAFLFPLFYQKNYLHILLLSFMTIMFTAFMIEHSIENSIGVGFYAFFIAILLSYLGANPPRSEIAKV